MANANEANENPGSSNMDDPRSDPEFQRIFTGYVDELNVNAFVDPDQVLADYPEFGPAILEDLETYVQLRSEEAVKEPLGTLGDYTLRREIGRGGMGVVYEAWEHSMDRVVALKVLPAGIAADAKACARFLREAQTAGKLNHPSVVGVYSTGVKEGTPWFSMEIVKGETLAEILARTRDAEPETETPFGPKDSAAYFDQLARVFADVADGLQHAHSKGVTHRDIKPSNLILQGGSRLRILDFGLARLEGQEALTLSGDFVGTPLYMSPEQARRKKTSVDYRTDVYSLGATMYEALCGAPPIRGKDHSDTLSRIVERDPVDPRRRNPRVPRDLETVVLKCLRKEARDRYGTAEALAQDLKRITRGDPVEAQPQASWERVARRLRRHRSRLLVAGLFVVALLTAGWLAWWARASELEALSYEHDAVVSDAAQKLYRDQAMPLRENIGMVTAYVHTVLRSGMVPAYYVYRALRFKRGRDGVAKELQDLERIADAVAERPEAPFFLALMHRALVDDDEAALREARRALKRDEDFVPAEVIIEQLTTWLEVQATAVDGYPSAGFAVSDEALDRMLERFRGRESWQEPWLLAYRHVQNRDWSAAVEPYGRLITWIRRHGEPYTGCSVEALMGRGLALLRMKRHHAAINDFAGARELWPAVPEAALALGVAHYLSGHRDEAESVFQELYELSADEEHDNNNNRRDAVATLITSSYHNLAEDDREREWSERLPEWKRDRLSAWYAYFQQRHGECAQAFGEILKQHPDDLWSLQGYGWSRVAMQWHRSGPRCDRERRALLADAQSMYKKFPNDASVCVILATAHQFVGHPEEARRFAARAVSIELHQGTRPLMGTRFLVGILRLQGKYERALDVLDRAEKSYGLKEDFERAMVLEDAGRYAEALAVFESGPPRKEPRSSLVTSRMARILNRLGQHEEARVRARETLDRAPRNTVAQEELALALLKCDRPREALELADRSVQEFPDRTRGLMIRGQILEGLGRVDEAAESYCAVLRLDAADPETHDAFAELLRSHKNISAPRELAAVRAAIAERIASGADDSRLTTTLWMIRERWESRD